MPALVNDYSLPDILTGQARCFAQPYLSTAAPVLPPRTLALGAAWPSPWTPVGATMKGLSFNFKRSTNDIEIEEISTPVAILTKKSNFEADLELSQDNFQTMQLAYGGGTITTVAAASGQPGYETFTPSDELVLYAFAFESMNKFAKPRRILVPIVVAVADAKTEYRRADQQRTYNVTLSSLVPISGCTFENVTSAALP